MVIISDSIRQPFRMGNKS